MKPREVCCVKRITTLYFNHDFKQNYHEHCTGLDAQDFTENDHHLSRIANYFGCSELMYRSSPCYLLSLR
jgi:hypothetical protein